ncbi:chromosome segregation protein (SMC) [Tunisvirus fontaine2]|uniref:Chromosome segregation protein (SMC) n=1 Tax=Tunisvirus fontaine2 TaxID=1421067 RepID=V9SFG0_9VIRU|nr:chromosome segregation protein (SMC) [Tunisvirus fontaine2]AHC55076.1 chromosome segregation protein (SMC) [Tunisvirus fontaine2]
MQNVKNFFRDVTLVGTVTSLPPALPRGALVYPEDSDDLYISNGTQWVIAGGDVGPLAAQVAQNTADILVLEGDVSTLQGQVSTNTTDISGLQTDVSTLQGQVSTLSTDVSTLQTQVATNTGDITTLQGDVVTLQGDVATNTADITTLQGDVTTLQGQVATNTLDISALQTQVATNAGDITTLQGDVTTLQGQVATNTGDITTLQGQVSTNTLDISALQTDVLALQGDVTTLQGDVVTNTTDIGILQGDVTTLQGQVATNTTNISTLQTSVSTLQTDVAANTLDISNLQTDVATNTGDIATLQGQVATNTVDIGTNTSDISTLQTTKENKSEKGVSGGYCPLTVSATPVVPSINLGIATKPVNGSLYFPFYTRLSLTADWSPGTATGTFNRWVVGNDTAYALNNAYGSGPKGATNITNWRCPRDAVVMFIFNIAFSVPVASVNRFFTFRNVPLVPANTELPHSYNYGIDNYTSSYSFAASLIIPIRQGDTISFLWNMNGQNPAYQRDFTYLHIQEMSFGVYDPSL